MPPSRHVLQHLRLPPVHTSQMLYQQRDFHQGSKSRPAREARVACTYLGLSLYRSFASASLAPRSLGSGSGSSGPSTDASADDVLPSRHPSVFVGEEDELVPNFPLSINDKGVSPALSIYCTTPSSAPSIPEQAVGSPFTHPLSVHKWRRMRSDSSTPGVRAVRCFLNPFIHLHYC